MSIENKKIRGNPEIGETEIIMSGIRASGEPHLGHLAGAWRQWLSLQEQEAGRARYFMIADAQALTDKGATPEGREKVVDSVRKLVCAMLAVGLDPERSVLVLQSEIPELYELTYLLAMLASWPSIERNPSLREDMKAVDLRKVSVGTLLYPVSQAADILGCKATLVPVGRDQLPVIYFVQDLIEKLNKTCEGIASVGMPVPRPLVGEIPSLVGIDGKGKAGKTGRNAIFLTDSREEVARKIRAMPTCPLKTRKTDKIPGLILDGEEKKVYLPMDKEPFIHVPLTYMLAFADYQEANQLFGDYRDGKIGDMEIKRRLLEVLTGILSPIQQRLKEINVGGALEIFIESSRKYRRVAVITLGEVKDNLRFGQKAYFEQ